MSEPANDPPLVTRPEPALAAPAGPEPAPAAPACPKPGFLEAVLWAAVFLGAQIACLILTPAAVFLGYACEARNASRFVTDQLDGLGKWAANEPGASMPTEFASSLAWGMLTAHLTSLALILLVLPRRIGPDWKRAIGLRRPRGFHVLLVLLITPGFLLAPDLVQQLVKWATGAEHSSARGLVAIFGTFPWPLTALAVAVGPGVFEELWFRGFLGRGLIARHGSAAGVLLTSVLFAVVHLSPVQFVVFVLMGAYLHFVYLASRSIWPGVLLHALNNGIGMSLALALPPEAAEQPTPIIVPLIALALILFGSVTLWTSRGRLEPGRGAGAGPWQPEPPGVSGPPADGSAGLVHAPVSPVALGFTVVSFGGLMYLAFRFSR